MLLPAVERRGPVSGPGHAVTELQGHGGRPGVRSVVSRESVVLGRRLVAVVGVVTVPSTHQTARAQAVHQGVALGELLVHPAAPVVVGRAAVTVVTLRLLPARTDTFRYQQIPPPPPSTYLRMIGCLLTLKLSSLSSSCMMTGIRGGRASVRYMSSLPAFRFLEQSLELQSNPTYNKHKLTCAEYRQSEQPGEACRQ